MPSVLKILLQRWPEAALVVFFQAWVFILKAQMAELMSSDRPGDYLPFWAQFVFGIASVGVAVVAYMLLLGFFVTAYRQGCTPQSPASLIRHGRGYFWRMIRFEMVFSMVMIGVSAFLFAVPSMFLQIEKGSAQQPGTLEYISMFSAMVILIKPALVIPAVMIVRDCMVMQAFRAMRDYRLSDDRRLPAIFLVCAAVAFLILSQIVPGRGFYYYAALSAYAVLAGASFLVVGLYAVRFAAAGELRADSSQSDGRCNRQSQENDGTE